MSADSPLNVYMRLLMAMVDDARAELTAEEWDAFAAMVVRRLLWLGGWEG